MQSTKDPVERNALAWERLRGEAETGDEETFDVENLKESKGWLMLRLIGRDHCVALKRGKSR